MARVAQHLVLKYDKVLIFIVGLAEDNYRGIGLLRPGNFLTFLITIASAD